MKISAALSAPRFNDHAQVGGPAGPKTSSTGLPAGPGKDQVTLSSAGAELAADPGADAHTHERIAAFETRTQSRIDLLTAREEGQGASVDFSGVADQFAANIARVQAGIDSGGLDAEGVARGLQNTLSLLRDGVQDALGINTPSVQSAPAGPPSVQSAPPSFAAAEAPTAVETPGLLAEPAAVPSIENADSAESRTRLSDLGREVSQRLASLDLSIFGGSGANPLQSLQDNFSAVLGRLDNALERGAVGQERLTSIVASAVDQLSAGLSDLFANNESLGLASPTDASVDDA